MNDEGGVGGFLGPHEYNATSASGKRISGSNSDFFFFLVVELRLLGRAAPRGSIVAVPVFWFHFMSSF